MDPGLSSVYEGNVDEGNWHHPPMQRGWVDAPHRRVELGDFVFEDGTTVADFALSFAVHGDWSDERLPVTLALCAIGSSHHRMDFLIGRGKPLDPRHTRILAVDAIGNGLATSPATSRARPGHAFPRFSIRDMVNSQKLLLERLGIARFDTVIGASMGGMQALQWGVSYPDAMQRIVALTPMARTTAWAAAVNHAARASLLAHLSADGLAFSADVWRSWVGIMQLIAMRTPSQVDAEFAGATDVGRWLEQRAQWWSRQGIHPLDWVYQSWAYDAHDIGTTPGFAGDTARALRAIRAPTLIAAAALDLYNPMEAARWAAEGIPRCEFHCIDSTWGHLAASDLAGQGARSIADAVGAFLRGSVAD